MMKNSLEIGTHARALSYTHGMTEIMSGYQPIINQLRARREQIGKNLQQNDYAEPDLGSYTENELILNYECMGSVDEDFEYEMSYDLSAKMKEIEGLCSSLNSMETVENDVEERLDDIEQYDMEKLNETLEKDVSEWTQEDIEFVAQEYTEAINEKDVETLNDIAAVLCESSFDVEQEGSQFFGTYYGGIPQDIRISILSCIDPHTEGEAYFTLSRLANENFCIDVNMGVYPYDKYETTLQFSVDENGQLTADLKCVNHFNKKDEIEGELKITSEDLYESADIQNMKVLGFSDEEIVAILSGAVTDTDVECVSQLCSCKTEEDYAKLFEVNPDNLSITTAMSYYLYSYGLYENSFIIGEDGKIAYDENHNFDQLTAFCNGILAKPSFTEWDYANEMFWEPEYSMEYLALMAICAEDTLNTHSAVIYSNYENVTDEMKEEQYKLEDIYSLYLGLECVEMEMEDRFDLFAFPNERYYDYVHISNLGWEPVTKGQKSITRNDANLFYSAGIVLGDDSTIEKTVLSMKESPTVLESFEELHTYNEKVKECRKVALKEISGSLVSMVSLVYPEVGLAVNVGNFLIEPTLGNSSKGITSASSLIKENKKVSNSMKSISYGLSAIEKIKKHTGSGIMQSGNCWMIGMRVERSLVYVKTVKKAQKILLLERECIILML